MLTILLCVALAGLRIWCCICLFPAQEWNDVRLRSAFLISDGLPLYPSLDSGPITTWIYGPVLPLLMLPVTLASQIEMALILAGAMNAFIVAGAIIFMCLLWPHPPERPWPLAFRLYALGFTLLLLPQTFFIFLQADNSSLGCGLVSLTCLARAQVGGQQHWWWPAAVFAGATAFSKLHGVTLPIAELAWLWFVGSKGQFRQFFGKLALVGTGLILITLGLSATPSAAWTMMIKVPSQLPLAPDLWQRLTDLAPFYVLMIISPAMLIFLTGWSAHLRSSGLGLPMLAWLASLPLGVAGTLTWGGAYNSLHGAFYLIPAMLVYLCVLCMGKIGSQRGLVRVAYLVGPILLLAFDKVSVVNLPKKPLLTSATEAVAISNLHSNQVWMPWRPLATRYATGRHDHDEDGLHIRQLTGFFPRQEHAYAALPPQWDCTVLQRIGMNWGIASAMHEPGAKVLVRDRWIWIGR